MYSMFVLTIFGKEMLRRGPGTEAGPTYTFVTFVVTSCFAVKSNTRGTKVSYLVISMVAPEAKGFAKESLSCHFGLADFP